jgi:carbon monoxide dehydrogenase subunit G
MHMAHSIAVDASREAVWDFLWDTERLAPCLPGCREIRAISPLEHYEATIEERIGPFRARFDWDISVEERDPLRQIRVAARGKDSKLGATARAEMAVRLQEAGSASTNVEIETELVLTGKIAALGQTVIKRKADQVMHDFAEHLRRRLSAPHGDGAHA